LENNPDKYQRVAFTSMHFARRAAALWWSAIPEPAENAGTTKGYFVALLGAAKIAALNPRMTEQARIIVQVALPGLLASTGRHSLEVAEAFYIFGRRFLFLYFLV
jgi:hypothetical protein